MKPAETKVRTYLPMIRRLDDGTWSVPGDETTTASEAVDTLNCFWKDRDWRIICLDVDGHISDVTEDALTEWNIRGGTNLFPTVEQREWAAESQAAEDAEWDQAIRQEYRALQRQQL